MKEHPARAFVVLSLLVVALVLPKAIYAQQDGLSRYEETPADLRPKDPELDGLMETAGKAVSAGGSVEDALRQAREALNLCEQKRLNLDCAIIKATIASELFALGEIKQATELNNEVLVEANRFGNDALAASVLVSLASPPKIDGNYAEALRLTNLALERAVKSKSLFLKAQVLAELAVTQQSLGNLKAAQTAITEAIEIDEANKYQFLNLHRVYECQISLSQATPDLNQIAVQLRGALSSATQNNNPLAALMAVQSLAKIGLRNGDYESVIPLLENASEGKLPANNSTFTYVPGFRSASRLPLFRTILLINLADSYRAAKRQDDAIKVLKELLEYADTVGFKEVKGGAAFELGSIYADLHKDDLAVSSLSAAAEIWRKVGYKGQLRITLANLADVLIRDHKSLESVPVLTEMIDVAVQTEFFTLAIIGETNLARALHSLGRDDDAETAYSKALQYADQAYADQNLDRKAVDAAVYNLNLSLFDFDNSKKNFVFALEDVERALLGADDSLQPDMRDRLFSIADNAVNLLKLKENSETFYQQGKYTDALQSAELLDALDRCRMKHKLKLSAPYDNKYLFDVPFKLATSPEGAKQLEDNLQSMGVLAGIARRVGYDALMRYNLKEKSFSKAEHYGELALQFANVNAEEPIHPDAELQCLYAYAAHIAGDHEVAIKATKYCTEESSKLQPPDEKLTQAAEALEAEVLSFTDPAASQGAIEWLLAKNPSDPDQQLALGLALLRQGKRKSALDALEKAIAEFSSRKDSNGEARARLEFGQALLKDDVKAKQTEGVKQLHKALEVFIEAKNNQGILQVRYALGDYYGATGSLDEALAEFRQAKEFAESLHDLGQVAYVTSRMGFALYSNGNKQDSLRGHTDAARLYNSLGNKVMESIEWRAIGGINKEQGRTEEARKNFLESQRLADATTNYELQISSRFESAFLFESLGDFGEALSVYREAEEIAKTKGQLRQYVVCARLVGWGLSSVGEWPEAVEQGNASLTGAKQLGDAQQEFQSIALLMNIYSDRRSSIKEPGKALQLYDRAKQLSNSDPAIDLRSLDDVLAELYWQLGKYDDAEASAQSAVSHYHATNDREDEAGALLSLSEAQRRKGNLMAASESLKKATQLLPHPADLYALGRLYYTQAGLEKAEGNWQSAIELYEKVIRLLDTISSSVKDPQQKAKLADSYSFLYEELIETLFEDAKRAPGAEKEALVETALRYSEANKAREFTSSWGNIFVRELRKNLPAELQERQERLSLQISSDSDRLNSLLASTGKTDKQLSASLEVAKKDWDALGSTLWRQYPSYASLVFPKPLSIVGLPLHSNETLIAFKVTDTGTFVWVLGVSAKEVRILDFYKTAADRRSLRKQISAIRTVFNRGEPGEFRATDLVQLFQALFPDSHAQAVANATELVIIPDDALFLLPVELLASSDSPILYPFLSKPIHYFPSLTAMTISRSNYSKPSWPAALFAIADPVVSAPSATSTAQSRESSSSVEQRFLARGFSLDPLPGTRKEVLSIVPLFSGQIVETRFGPDATKKAFLETDLSRYRFLHFATHGLMPTESSLVEPALVFSRDASNPDDMFLQLSEILQLHIRAETVVLSACNTGSGDVSKAEGVSNLGRAFLMAGAESSVVSLWSVADDSTALLMQRYYEGILKGKSKARSLADSRLSVAKDPRFDNPYYWSAFILIGD